MTDITEQSLQNFFDDLRRSVEPEAYRAHLRAQTFRVRPPGYSDTVEPTIESQPMSDLFHARALLEKNGFTVIPTRRLASVSAIHCFDWREVETIKDFDGLVNSVFGSLAAQLGIELVKRGGAIQHDVVSRPLGNRVIGHSAVVIMPEKAAD